MSEDAAELAALHDELRSVARELLAKAGEESAVDWQLIARSGWLGLEVPAEFDGAEATFAETAVILGELGRAAARGPYPSVALAVHALDMVTPGAYRDELLHATVAGTTVPAVVIAGEGLEPGMFRVEDTADGAVLTGHADFVLDATAADRLLVPAVQSDGSAVLVAIEPTTPGVAVTPQPVVDETRSLASVEAAGAVVEPEALWQFENDAPGAVQRLRHRASVAVACDSLGIAEAMVDATVAYAGVREQFGRKIGSFQAVKHACADMLVRTSVARRLIAGAVRAQVEADPDAALAAHMAKSYTCAAAVDIAGKAMQLHGGMGYTWESGIHVYLKRATLNRSLYGSPGAHRRRIAERYSAQT
ncbi:acyl-CoA dehydrogenase family protein [Aldersonia kunmingensis]|uniref:acyl-CoA dehydrogenase family protein n=1 Tax=Aldersonia kunmingensis TaxID=408066 RepID=UPI00082E1BE6|nr:acyl-CoA dehydrogenase family protein [Aldersonia kunmingensis]